MRKLLSLLLIAYGATGIVFADGRLFRVDDRSANTGAAAWATNTDTSRQNDPLSDGILAWDHLIQETNVVVDNINLVDLNTRAASEAQAKKGHDLFMFLSPPAAYRSKK